MPTAIRSTTCPNFIVIILATIACLSGCATPPKGHPPGPVSHSRLEPAQSTTAADLFPLLAGNRSIGRQIGNQGRHVLNSQLKSDAMSKWQWILEDVRVLHLLSTENGALLLTAEEEYQEAVHVTYDPPLIMLPAYLAMNQPITQRTEMTIVNRSDGSPRDHGWCTHRVELLGRWSITTSAGTFNTFVVQTQRDIELNLAQVQVTSVTSYAPGLGMIVDEIHRITRPMRLFDISQTETLELDRLP